MNDHAAKLSAAPAAIAFMLAGKARVTMVSKATGARFTYQIKKGKGEGAPHFVALLSGPDNTADYRFLGTIFTGDVYRHGQKSAIGRDAPSAQAFAWAWGKLVSGEMPEKLEVWHEGCCGRCGRDLTVPESIAAGLGPECQKRAA